MRPALRLPLDGAAPAPVTPPRLALAAKGFRPFFLLAAAAAAVILPVWMLALLGVIDPGGYIEPIYWHAHEMIFGFTVAVIAGFLLTAIGNWTKRETLIGAPLLALAGLWLAGRIAMTGVPLLPRWGSAILDLAFLPVLVIVLARPLIASKNRRNFVMLGILVALFAANVTIHLDALGVLPGWRRRGSLIAVDIVVLVIMIIAGRVFPMFTRNATGVAAIRSIPRLDALSLVAMATFVILDAAIPARPITAIAAGAAGVLAAARSVHWGARSSAKTPLLWVLHVGYAWIPLGLILRALSGFVDAVPSSIATHALTVGAIGTLTLGMMARVALGHTGRMLTAPRLAVIAFALVTFAAIARVLPPLVDLAWARASVFVAGVLWTTAFVLYLVAYVPILMTPARDGR